MSKTAISVYVWGLYIVSAGTLLALIPGKFLPLLGVPAPADFWPRLLGIIFIILGGFHLLAARNNLGSFFRGTIPARIFGCLGLSTLFLTGLGPKALLFLGMIDLLGAISTVVAMRKDRASAR